VNTSSESRRGRLRILAVVAAATLAFGACSNAEQSPGATGGGLIPGESAAASGDPGASMPAASGATPAPSAAQPSPAELAGGGPDIATTIEPPTGEAQIEIWNHFTGPDGAFFRALVDKFNEEQQACTANVRVQLGEVFNQQVVSAAVGQQLPHILAGGYDRIPFLASEGVLVPVTETAEKAGFSAQTFPEAIWNAGMYNGEQFGIPLDTHPAVFFYNKALLEDAGVEPPTDRESFEAAIAAVNEQTDADGYQMVGSGRGGTFLVGLQFATLFYQGGGEWTNGDFTEATFNSEAGIQAAEYLHSLTTDHGVPIVESDQEIAAFAAGDNAMVLSGIWESTRYAEALGDDLGMGTFPAIFGDGSWGGSHQLMLTTRADESAETRACSDYFIDWLSANSYNWAEGGQVPARNEVRQAILDADASSLNATLALIQQAAPVAEVVQFLPTIPSGGDLLFGTQGSGEAAVTVVNGTPAEEALNNAAEFYTQRLQEDKQTYGY
jgi:multiple sugar transport system substrate-binding protein